MPQYFQLISKATGQPATFTDIDAAMCKHFGAECHEVNWHHHWYPLVMEWGVAFGKTFAEMKDIHRTGFADLPADDIEGRRGVEHLLEIIDWLNEHYTPDAWAQIGR